MLPIGALVLSDVPKFKDEGEGCFWLHIDLLLKVCTVLFSSASIIIPNIVNCAAFYYHTLSKYCIWTKYIFSIESLVFLLINIILRVFWTSVAEPVRFQFFGWSGQNVLIKIFRNYHKNDAYTIFKQKGPDSYPKLHKKNRR